MVVAVMGITCVVAAVNVLRVFVSDLWRNVSVGTKVMALRSGGQDVD